MATQHRARLGDRLMARGVITEDQLGRALEVQQRDQQKRLLGEILVDLGYVSQEQVLSAVAEACGVPFVRLTPPLVDLAVRAALPETFLQKRGILPLFRVRDVLTVAVSEPSNLLLVDEIAHAAGVNVQVAAATPANIYQMLEETRQDGTDGDGRPEGMTSEPLAPGELLLPDDYDSVYGNWAPEKIADLLVREAVRARANAIHIEPDEKVLRVRFRVDGVLHIVMRPSARLAGGLANAFEEMMGSGGQGAPGRDLRQSARLVIQGRVVQLHVAALGGAFGPRMVVRIVRDDEAKKPLEQLGGDFESMAAYRALLAERRGLVVVAGMRESGATTTLYSTLNALDPVRLNVCALELRTNFNLLGVNQFSPASCGTTDPAAALSQVLLQQPDVLVLDGVMSGQVPALAVEAANDGCLVLAQVRATDAAEAMARLAAQAPPETLATALRGVLAQRLVRTVCLQCRGACDPPAPLGRCLAETFGPIEEYIKGRGCGQCGRTGFVGRIGLFEFVPMSQPLTDLLRSRPDAETLRTAIRAAGHPSLWVDGVHKVRAGITSIDEVLTVLRGCPGGPVPEENPAVAGRP